MKRAVLALLLLGGATVAQAQPYRPYPPGPPPGPAYGGEYWREHREGQEDWRRREEFREAEHRRWEWRRAHCVRDYRGQEFCR